MKIIDKLTLEEYEISPADLFFDEDDEEGYCAVVRIHEPNGIVIYKFFEVQSLLKRFEII